ncbi:DNA polymerase beta subunit [Caballeronia terrestris]|uniref:DNA polymerase beta subunit n=1 Tax=Caballeronia terrestris TaxID=1226301 RepID=A0A158IC44_9BURK|nr:DNA polymerase beta subunit [Caballeronia terrestris]
MRPSVVLELKRSAIREAVSWIPTANPREFGSTKATSTCWSTHFPAQLYLILAACKRSLSLFLAFASI